MIKKTLKIVICYAIISIIFLSTSVVIFANNDEKISDTVLISTDDSKKIDEDLYTERVARKWFSIKGPNYSSKSQVPVNYYFTVTESSITYRGSLPKVRDGSSVINGKTYYYGIYEGYLTAGGI